MNEQKILNLIDSTRRQIDRMRSPEAINRVLTQTLNEIKRMCLSENACEPLYTANQHIWFHTGDKKQEAVFLAYVGETVKIRTYGSMYPQHVYVSYISPREEQSRQKPDVAPPFPVDGEGQP